MMDPGAASAGIADIAARQSVMKSRVSGRDQERVEGDCMGSASGSEAKQREGTEEVFLGSKGLPGSAGVPPASNSAFPPSHPKRKNGVSCRRDAGAPRQILCGRL